MRPETEVTCDYCGREYLKPLFRVYENGKRGWKNYCSSQCQYDSIKKRKTYTCSNPNCQKEIIHTPSAIKPSGNIFCSHSCAATVTNKNREVSTSKYKTTKAEALPECKRQGCSNIVALRHNKYCSVSCGRKKPIKHYRQKALKGIRDFYQKHGRIPMKREVYHLYQPNPVQFAKHYTAQDGHQCDSMSERIIDDWLYNRHIPHQINVEYPWQNGMTVDFKVADFWIEFFGLNGHLQVYDQLKDKKLKLAKKHQLNVLAIYPKDLKNHKLCFKLKLVLDHFSQSTQINQPTLFPS